MPRYVLGAYLEANETHLIVGGLTELLTEVESELLLLVSSLERQHAHNAVQDTLNLSKYPLHNLKKYS